MPPRATGGYGLTGFPMTTPNIYREFCSRCGGPNGRKHSWCKTCFSFYARGSRPDFGPPRACRNGHPYVDGSYYIRERDACRKCKVCQRQRWHAKEKARRQLKRAEASRQRREAAAFAAAAEAAAAFVAAVGRAPDGTAA